MCTRMVQKRKESRWGESSLTVDPAVGTVRASAHLGGAVAHGVLDLKRIHVQTLQGKHELAAKK